MGKSIIGFHYSIGGNKQGIGQFMQRLNEAGIPFLMKGTDDAGLCFGGQETGRTFGVDNWLIYRLSTAGQPGNAEFDVPDYLKSPAAAAEEHWQKTVARWPPELDKSVVWMEPINEPRAKASPDDEQWEDMHPTDWLGWFMLEYARIANENGCKVCGPSFNSGEPEVLATNDYELPGMVAYLRYCAENPHQAALSVHEYVWRRWKDGEDWEQWYPHLWGRVEAAMAAADANNIPHNFPIFVTEWGFAHMEAPRWPQCEPYLTSYNAWAARWPQVKGVAAWTLQGNWGNVDDHIQSWIEPLAEYALTREFDAGDQPAQPHASFVEVTGQGEESVQPQGEMATAFDGLDNPVGWDGNHAGPNVWARNYLDVNPIGSAYDLGFHTGADLNDNATRGWDSDKKALVYAIGNGTVTCAGKLPGLWGNVIVIDHGQFMSRYGHLHEIKVEKGDTVRRGEEIGRIGDAFGQLPYHLHFDISPTRILEENPGHWPGSALQKILQNYVEPKSVITMTRPGRGPWPQPTTGHTTANVNFRCGPATSFSSYRVLPQGREVTILQEHAGWKLLQLKTGEFGWSFGEFIAEGEPTVGDNGEVVVVGEEPTSPADAVTTMIGVHATADGGLGPGWEQPVRGEFATLKPGVVKFQSNHDPQMIDAIMQDNRQHVETVIVRAFLDWGNRALTSAQFVDFTLSDMERSINHVRSHGLADEKIIVELHNEPNLLMEGLTHSWVNGNDCVSFFTDVLDRYKSRLPNVRYGMGGLSPGAHIPNVRRDSFAFLDEMRSHPRWSDFDVHCVHLYTSGDWNDDIGWLDHCQTKTPATPIWITESSWHTADGTGGSDYGAKLVELLDLLDERPVHGITFYCISASNPDFYHEVWCRSANKERPWERIESRGVAAEIRRLRPPV